MALAVQELHDKASRAWFGISNVIYRNKRMEVDKIFGIFNSLVTPVATYGSPFWLPLTIPKKYLENEKQIMDYWESFKSELLQQKCARIVLSVHKKTSRLAVLGELAQYPLFLQSLSQCSNYKLSLLNRRSSNTLIGHVLKELETMSSKGHDCWLTRVNKIENSLKIPKNMLYNKSSGKRILSFLKGKFDGYFLDQINRIKIVSRDTTDHNKLRTYKSFKGSFTREPYLTLVRNRNQRCHLTRLRVSSHNLRIELGRHTRPITPVQHRTCQYCHHAPPPLDNSDHPATPPDTEIHFLVQCPLFFAERNCLFGKINSINPGFETLSLEEKFKVLLCPTTAKTVKLINKFIKIMFEGRKKIDQTDNVNPSQA